MKAQPFGDPLHVVVSRRDIESLDTGPTLSVLGSLTKSPGVARANMENVDVMFHGYDDDSRELFEVPEVRSFVVRVDEEFPFWLFFLSKHRLGLQCVAYCFLSPYLTDEARVRIHRRQLQDLLERRWFPAMNHMARFAGLTESEVDELTDRALLYLLKGRFGAP